MTNYPQILSYGWDNYSAIVQIIVLAVNILGVALVGVFIGIITKNENKQNSGSQKKA